ncbi:hypothetical protein [Pedobacter alluvionis]|uniref:Lipoprotein n=1 Tax=Pedobacter alluvionis TaxID=475253 RepID=A0A497XST1_9SPHI|nr:hypothetical protein [Pedobacter alluvionis]RLJ72500.1 hypothetical protein BCL90_4121 [Pedobacter alluvionis]TFB28177.1 hypothetical protein E3V97_24475 [Pedobacter alluvionis]
MENYITEKNKWLWLFIIALCIACTSNNEKSIPQDIIAKSTGYTVRKYKRYLYPEVCILKNELTREAKMVNIDGMEVNLIDEKAVKSTEISTIEFYKFMQIENGNTEIELVLMPRRQYIRFRFKKSGNETWDSTTITPWQD